ncbi:hypothetical protein V8C37DRAFT_61221 [Trichoderma ceciliae]
MPIRYLVLVVVGYREIARVIVTCCPKVLTPSSLPYPLSLLSTSDIHDKGQYFSVVASEEGRIKAVPTPYLLGKMHQSKLTFSYSVRNNFVCPILISQLNFPSEYGVRRKLFPVAIVCLNWGFVQRKLRYIGGTAFGVPYQIRLAMRRSIAISFCCLYAHLNLHPLLLGISTGISCFLSSHSTLPSTSPSMPVLTKYRWYGAQRRLNI